MILIISNSNDLSTTTVIEWLNFFNKKWIRVNNEDYVGVNFLGSDIEFNVNSSKFKLSEITSCWYRRGFLNLKFIIKNEIKQFQDFNDIEARRIEQYIYYKLSLLRKINYYSNSNVNKLIVSDIARSLEIKTPNDYLISSKNELKKIMVINNQNLITKSIWGNPIHRFENFTLFNYTQKVEFEKIEKSSFAVSLVQNYIDKKYELRIFYLEKKTYAMAIFSQNDTKTTVDFRNYNKVKPNRSVPFKLPFIIEQKLIKLMNKLDLNCGSIDMIVDKNNEYYFLEVNPIGQYGMVSDPCNYELDRIIAKYL
jgi:ATP-GRASP peptide maturase of grasp-with-spasm system